MKTETTDNFINGLRKNERHDTHVFFNLFSLLQLSDENFLDVFIENYKKDYEVLFGVFHKTFRQCDVFNDDKITCI